MNNQFEEILGVASGNKALQINLDTRDIVQVGLAVAGGMLLALLLFEAMKAMVKG